MVVAPMVGMTTIPIKCALLQPAEQEQGSKMMTRSNRLLSRTWRACNAPRIVGVAVLVSEGSSLKHYYVKTNERRPMLSAAEM